MPLSFAVIAVLVWFLATSFNNNKHWMIPSPVSILRVFIEHPVLILSHAVTTINETVIGLFLSILLGFVTAAAMDQCNIFKKVFYPYIIASQTIPIITLAPLVILWFGYGVASKIFVVILVCFFPITLNLFDGFSQVNIEQLRLFKSMNASSWQIFLRLKLPNALPAFFTGLKLAVSYSVMAAIIGEWLGGESGLGIYMTRATKSYQTAHVFAIILLITVFSLFLYGLVAFIERIVLKWRFTRLSEYIDT
jgi:ABC-type nitrate/sulfonate/bicarbonate transport system permease component